MTNDFVILERFDSIPREYEGTLLKGISEYAF